ncbi:MAG: ComEC/Rec2 family competence protein, partial [Microbacterium sp.]
MTSARRARRRDARLIPAAALAWVAAALSTRHPSFALGASIALWGAAAGLLAVAALVRGRGWTALAAIAFAFAAAVCTHVAAAEPARAAVAALSIGGGRALSVEVTAVGKIERAGDAWRFDATLNDLRYGGVHLAPQVPVLVRSEAVPDGLDLGARVRMAATAWVPDAGERAVLVLDATGGIELVDAPPGVLAVAAALRDGLVTLTADLPPPGAGLIAGLAVGDTGAVTDDLDAAMKTSSLSHLTAVSGANCALVVGLAFGVAALCGARRGVRVAAGLSALAGFVVLVSPEPSVVRAAAMATIAMLGLLLGRTGAGLSLLTASVAIVLMVDPWLAGSLGFGLSVAATAALLLLAGPLAEGLGRWMPAPLALAVAVPLSAQLVCGPLLVLIAPQLSVYGVLANLLVAPAAPIGTVVGLAACLAAGIPWLGAGLAGLAWLPAAWIAGTAVTLAGAPGSTMEWPDGIPGMIALAVVGAAVAALLVRARPWLRRVAAATVAASLICVLAFGPVADAVERGAIPRDWTIAACDVGQGDALLVRSDDIVMLIDTGPEPVLLEQCLGVLGIGRIALLVLTHFDLDHSGGVPGVLGRVDAVLHGPADTSEAEAVLQELNDGGARLVAAAAGLAGTLGEAHWRVLW